ncbi:MAG: imidazoleglycerol-phosphate dehydratase, partial [bacterium]|nr:imidazoleglycerol-phosphate dehydratase [bacterium]
MRTSKIHRKTSETDIEIELVIYGQGNYRIETPVGFFTHMLESFAKHGLFDLSLRGKGDLHVDQHHLVEDCGIVLGQAFKKALGDRKGINRAGYF